MRTADAHGMPVSRRYALASDGFGAGRLRHGGRSHDWLIGGLILLVCHVVLAAVSPRFAYEADPLGKPVVPFVTLLVTGGAAFLLVARYLRHSRLSHGQLLAAIAMGLAMRVILVPSVPILEDDWYRYLWEGALTANGISPYEHVPQEAIDSINGAGTAPPALRHLAEQAGWILQRANQPTIRSVYPPVAQMALALAWWIQPWSLAAWKLVLLCLDPAILALILATLRRLELPAGWSLLYWWNPLLIKEVFNSGHMEPLVLVFVMGAVLLAMQRHFVTSSAVLALAAGAKLWPIVLLPILLRPALARPRRLVPAVLVFATMAGILLAPMLSREDRSSGACTNYWLRWQSNAAMFQIVVCGMEQAYGVLGQPAWHAQWWARLLTSMAAVFWVLWLASHPMRDPRDVAGRCLLAVAGVFLLSPTGFPWYATWMIPLLAIQPRWSLLALAVVMPLYYLRYWFEACRLAWWFDHVVVWVEFLPVWGLMAWESWRRGAAQFYASGSHL
mgnify:CR=1 FL=1